MSRSAAFLFVCMALAACNSASGQPGAAPAPGASVTAPVMARASKPLQTAAAADPPVDKNDYVPAEFKAGAARWKDTGVYLDGKPIAFLTFGELPITLKPTWVKDKVSANKRPGTNDPAWRWAQQRYYKFTDYLRALGIDPRSIREMHVYGAKMTESIIVTGRDLSSPRAAGFMFRFGGDVAGKAIPQEPANFGNGRTPDKISAVMIYVKKTPPTLVRNDGFYLDGQLVNGVPYYGEPLRGGVRVYLDDRLATIIKRQDLDMKSAIDTPDGPSWSLYDFLKARGVDTSKIVEGWAVARERRTDRIPAAALSTMTFAATAQAKGVVTLGPAKITANAIALHTRTIKPDELPVIGDDEK
jgi:hypothetical protein